MAEPTPETAASTTEPVLRGELEAVVGRLRAGLAALFAALSLDPGRPQSISRALRIDKTLAWRSCRFTRADEPTEALGFLPGVAALERLWSAARQQGADEARLAAARRAADELQALAERHAGGRPGLRRLLANLSAEEGRPGLQDDARRQAFGGNVAIWGVQASARLGFHAVAPSAGRPERLDLVSVGGLHGLHRLRASARWPVIRHTTFHGDDDGDGPSARPIDQDVAPGEPPLLKRFCSDPLPTLQSRPVRDGTVFELGDGGLGRTAAVTCLFGMLHRRAVPRTAREPGEQGELYTFLNTPAERAVVDLALHRDLGPIAPELQLCSLMESTLEFGPEDGSRYPLPVAERLQELGGAHPVLETPCFPRHRELVESCLARLGHPPDAFHFFRVELAFPPIPTVACLRFPLPGS